MKLVEEPIIAESNQHLDALTNLASGHRDENPTTIYGGGREATNAVMEVLIVHEDLPMALGAKQVLDRLTDSLGLKLHFVTRFWAFEELRDPLLLELAVGEATQAHILFVSLHGNSELPQAVSTLIDCWIADREEQYSALVVSLDNRLRESPTTNAVLDYLCTKAIAGRVDLFPHFAATTPTGWNSASQESQVQDIERQRLLGPPNFTARFRDGRVSV